MLRYPALCRSVNGKRVLGRDFTELVRSLQHVGRPVEFGLVPPIDVRVAVSGPPLELELRRVSGRVTVTGFCEVSTVSHARSVILSMHAEITSRLGVPGIVIFCILRSDQRL